MSDYFLHASGEVVAFGRDPYFPPWTDTAQLDYSNARLRAFMIDTLKQISRYADGVRCDMAMLVLRDYIRHQWFQLAPDPWFNERMPGEFWDEAIAEIKRSNPDFKFIAEAYWDKEPLLHRLGFDLTYEKKLYDGLVAGNSNLVMERLALDSDSTVFSHAHNLASAALILSLPGSVLIHEGQMEGKHERLPVQRVKPLIEEPPDTTLREAYVRILKATSDEIFKSGDFSLFDCKVYGTVAFIRQNQGRVIAYIGQISDAWHKFNSASLNVSPIAQAIGAREYLRLTNLLTSQSTVIREVGGAFRIQPNEVGVDIETVFCLVEATALKERL
jgi:hypothetical protein